MTLSILTSLLSAGVALLLAYIAHNEKDKHKMKTEILSRQERREVDHLIDLRLKPTEVEIKEIKDDLVRIEKKLDILIERILSHK